MKITRKRFIPQLELGPSIGGLKQMYMRSGAATRPITMVSAMTAAYSTTPEIKAFFGSFLGFMVFAGLAVVVYMIVDFTMIYPSEQTFNQDQAQRAERSPLKRDTEEVLDRLDQLEGRIADD